MVEIGDRPVLVHIMELFARHGLKEFCVAGGYKIDVIKDYFANFALRKQDYVLDMASGRIDRLGADELDWRIGIYDTGQNTMTGGRLLRLAPHLGRETFMMTYGDGLADIDIRALLDFHKSHGKLATVTAVRPPARFGALDLDGEQVRSFQEKNPAQAGWINGGFFVLEPTVLDYIDGDATSFEAAPLTRLAAEGELMAYRHSGFWQPMDTLREKQALEALWASGDAPWARQA